MQILFPVLIVAAIALVAGVGLGVANRFMAVAGDPKAEAIEKVLPGANCGACGYSGCKGYANALAEGSAQNGQCSVGGDAVAKDIGEILGVAPLAVARKTAVVHCRGTADCQKTQMRYDGISSCKAASGLYGGSGACAYGCIGLGDCADHCEFDAIAVCNGVAMVNDEACRACGKCVSACPRGLISLVPYEKSAVVLCSNLDKGTMTKAVCSVGCIGCRMCAKVCEAEAITFEGGCARIQAEKCVGCGKCASACKLGVIRMQSQVAIATPPPEMDPGTE